MYQKYLDAVNLHVAWLNASEIQSEMIENIVLSYNTILKEMKDVLINSIVKYDFCLMAVAVFFLCQVSKADDIISKKIYIVSKISIQVFTKLYLESIQVKVKKFKK